MGKHTPTPREIESFFFRGAIRGWVCEGQGAILVPDNPGFLACIYREHFFAYRDEWIQTEAGVFAGTTTIWHGEIPAWVMQYEGAYPKQDIPLVKRALHEAYRAEKFLGGRGPERHELTPSKVYANDAKGDVEWFCGTDAIQTSIGLPLGYCNYRGRVLF